MTTVPTGFAGGGDSLRASLRPVRRARPVQSFIEFLLLIAAVCCIAITGGIVYILVSESVPFFRVVSLWTFLTDTMWTPQFEPPRYGILPLLCGTFVTTTIALAVAMPVGTILAIWLSEFAPARLREIIKPVLEVLSAVPTVVFGYFAVQVVTALIKKYVYADLPTFNMLSAGLVMGIMIVPYVCSLSEDAMRSVPMLLREGSYAMGASKITTAVRVVYPAALSGIGAAYTLAIARAVGETMIVAIAAGQQPTFTLNPAATAETVTAYIVRVSMGDLQHGSIGYQTIFAAGVTLFVMTLGFNLLGHYLRKRFRQEY